MVERGVIAGYDDPADLVASLPNFFGLASPEQWDAVWGRFEVAFRKTWRLPEMRFETTVGMGDQLKGYHKPVAHPGDCICG